MRSIGFCCCHVNTSHGNCCHVTNQWIVDMSPTELLVTYHLPDDCWRINYRPIVDMSPINLLVIPLFFVDMSPTGLLLTCHLSAYWYDHWKVWPLKGVTIAEVRLGYPNLVTWRGNRGDRQRSGSPTIGRPRDRSRRLSAVPADWPPAPAPGRAD